MSDAPRRRRRAGQPRRPQNPQSPVLPLAIVIVLVGGFAIGAFLSQHRHAQDSIAKTSTTTRQDVTPEPLTPSPTVRQAASPQVSETPISESTHAPVTPATASSPALTTTSKRTARTIATAAPTVAATVPARPSIAPSVPEPRPAPLPSSRRAPSLQTQTPRAISLAAPVLSGGPDHVVRSYLAALIRGDGRTANTALGRGPDSGNNFPEQDFIDAKSRIKSLHTTVGGDGGYTVETEVVGSKGLYYVTFQVQKTPDGYVIGEHSYIKP